MKILKRKIIKGQGFVQMIPTEEEDLWHIYNLISEGDRIKSITTRKIVTVSQSGVKNCIKKRIILILKVVKITYHAGVHLALEIKGQNCEKNDYLSLNQHHTFALDLDQPITIIKNDWYGYHYKILKELSDPTHDSDVAAMVMDEGIAHLCYVKSSITLLKSKVEKSIPKKKSGAKSHEEAMQKFFQMCFESLMLIDFKQIQCFIIASPGFVKDEFMKYIKEQQQQEIYAQKFKQQQINQKLLVVRSSSGYLNGLNDVLQDPTVMTKLQDTKAVKQIKIFDQFYSVMSKDENMVAYSEKDVFECHKQSAIQTLLISDSLFRTKDLQKRKVFNGLVDSVNRQGGETYIFSSLHNSGEKLNNLSGIAAILKFPVHLDDEDEDDEEDTQEQKKKQQQQNQNQDNNKKKSDIFDLIAEEDICEDDEDNGEDEDDFANYKIEEYEENVENDSSSDKEEAQN